MAINAATLRKRVDVLRTDHVPVDPEIEGAGQLCNSCSQLYPCRVIRILDGEITDPSEPSHPITEEA